MSLSRILSALAAAGTLLLADGPPKVGTPAWGETLSSVVEVTARVPTDARTAPTLGTERGGSGVVIDDDGLVATIGYLILEAEAVTIGVADGRTVPAEVVAYDHGSGFGVLRTLVPPGVPAIELGTAGELAAGDGVLVAPHGGRERSLPVLVTDRRDFAGYWEYLLENAIFTAPPHPQFGGAALIDGSGRLVGVGSLLVPDAARGREGIVPGNMFVPVDQLTAVLGELISRGRSRRGNRPWLGIHSEILRGRLFVARVARSGPAWAAGVRAGDLVLAVGDSPVADLADFYRKVWAYGEPGVEVPLQILQGNAPRRLTIRSIDRHDWLKLHPNH